jgi:hypothetical protein
VIAALADLAGMAVENDDHMFVIVQLRRREILR